VVENVSTMTLTAQEKANLLDQVDLFAGLGGISLEAIAGHAIEVEFAPGHPIVRQGEVGAGFFLVVSGAARVIRDGDEIARLGPGEFFGELALLDRQPRIATVAADGPTTCLAIASWEFEQLLDEQPRLALGILRAVVRRLRAMSEPPRH